jgi:hypothetical protein
MSTQVQYRRGSNVQVAAFTGALGELVIDTTNKIVVVNDGATAGGFPAVGLTATQTITNKIYQGTSVSVTGNVTGGNIVTSGAISITGASTAASYSATGNVNGGNLTTGGAVSATGTITGGNLSTGGNVNVSGYLSVVGNLYVANVVSTGNLQVTDPLVYFVNTSSYPYNFNIGFYSAFTGGGGNTYQHTGLVRDYTTNTWNLFSNVPEPAGTTIDFTNAIYDPLKMGQLTVNTGSNVTAIVNGAGNAVGNIGSSTGYFNTVFAKSTSAQYADLAEMYCADSNYVPGTVVEFGGTYEVTATTESHSTRVAGIISTNPSYLMNSTLECENSVAVALTGRVPCQVVGTIRKGDRLVASGLHKGVATGLDMSQYQPGCIIGKALEEYNSLEPGVIEVAVGRN